MQDKTFIAKTFFGLEEVLAQEIRELGGTDVAILNRAVSFKGNTELLYKSNIMLRTALRILCPIHHFSFSDYDDFYHQVKKMKWDNYMAYTGELAIDAVVNSKIVTHSKYVALRTKDAVVDYFRDQYGQRPSVNVLHPDLRIHVHISENKCDISLDSSGDPLFMRGYRSGHHTAPLNEVLAAGMILLSGWDKKSPFIDPMCGSGTLGIEAAMIAHNIPPGIIRKDYGFMKWYDYDESLYLKIKQFKPVLGQGPEIICSDISPFFSRMAKASLKKLGIGDTVKCFTKDFEKLQAIHGEGVIMLNPPYGERLETPDLFSLYGLIGSRLKHEWMGYEAWVLTANADASKAIGLKSTGKTVLYNGALECRFMNYSLYEGSKKQKKAGL